MVKFLEDYYDSLLEESMEWCLHEKSPRIYRSSARFRIQGCVLWDGDTKIDLLSEDDTDGIRLIASRRSGKRGERSRGS
jgi:hypothetical protein